MFERVKKAREAIGKDTALFVDANAAYTARQALDFAWHFADFNVTWFEEPVAANNLKGLNFIRETGASCYANCCRRIWI